MKKKISNACKCILFLLLVALMFNLVSEGMKSNDTVGVTSVGGLYQQERNSLDVVAIGASEVYTSFSPTMAYEQQGFTAYSLGCPGCSGNLYKYMLAEVLKYQKPQVVVFEINGFINSDKYYHKEATLRNIIDSMRWSKNRLDAIKNLVPEDEQTAYLFPLAKYHGQWSTPSKLINNSIVKLGMMVSGRNHLKGVSTYSYNHVMTERGKKDKYTFTDEGREYLDDLMQYCKDNGLTQVLFVRAPHGFDKADEDVLDQIWEEIESYGYDVLDCNSDWAESGIDLGTDFYNPEHLNVYGMEKFTKYLSNYLMTHYNIAISHSEKLDGAWQESVAKANEIFDACRKDIADGKVRHYMELSFFRDTKTEKDYKKVLKLE